MTNEGGGNVRPSLQSDERSVLLALALAALLMGIIEHLREKDLDVFADVLDDLARVHNKCMKICDDVSSQPSAGVQ